MIFLAERRRAAVIGATRQQSSQSVHSDRRHVPEALIQENRDAGERRIKQAALKLQGSLARGFRSRGGDARCMWPIWLSPDIATRMADTADAYATVGIGVPPAS